VSKASAATLLGLAAPLVLDAVGKEAGARRLDARGLSHFLADQGRKAEGVLPASVSTVLGTGTRQREAYGVARPAEVTRRHEPKRTWIWIAAGIALLALFALWLARRGQTPSLPDVDLPQPSVNTPTAPPLPEGQQAAPTRPSEPAEMQDQPAVPPPAPAPAAEERAAAPQPEPSAAAEPPAAGIAQPGVLSAATGMAALESFLDGQAPTPQRFVLEGIEFSSGSSQIGSSSLLDGVGQTLAEHEDARIRIEGHADATGDPTSNLALSEARANAVKDYLVTKGVTGDRIETRGLGADEPLAPNETASDRTQNRRVELVVLQR
jgi:outer membrane protein OmpA-like peptidoglycan-associated protein